MVKYFLISRPLTVETIRKRKKYICSGFEAFWNSTVDRGENTFKSIVIRLHHHHHLLKAQWRKHVHEAEAGLLYNNHFAVGFKFSCHDTSAEAMA